MRYTVLKVDMMDGTAVVGNKEDGTMETYSLNAFNYTPNVGDVVSVYHNENETMIVLEEEARVDIIEGEPLLRGYKVNKIAYALLAIFVGELGVHHYYAGNNSRGTKYLLLTLLLGWTVIVPIVICIKCIIQAVKVLSMPADRDGNVIIYN